MISFKDIIFFITLSFGLSVQARIIELEFEKIDDAVHYQFEFRLEGQSEILKTLSQNTVFVEIDLPFDHYEYRQRAYDRRNVPGSWSSWEKFTVSVPELKLISPLTNTQIAEGSSKQPIKFEWQGAEGIQKFRVVVQDMVTLKIMLEQIVDARSTELLIPAGSLFNARVTTVLDNNKWPDLETSAQVQFSIQANALGSPQVVSEKNRFMREISWAADPLAESYEIILERASNQTKKWVLIFESKNFKSNKLKLNSKWGGGSYRLKIVSKAKYRKDSPVLVEKFILASDRTPAAEYNELVLRSIDRVDGYYTQISWLMTQLRLNSFSFETGTQANAKPLGGTLRAGFGYFGFNSAWGASSYINSTRMIINNQNKNFFSCELNGVYRTKFSYRDELRLSIGLSDLQVPVLVGDSLLNEFSIENSNVVGPKLALEYWYSLSPKIGLQISYNQNFYNLISNKSAPNGKNLNLSKSYQVGMMASYRISQRVTGLLGLVHQEENYEFEALTRDAPQPIVAGSMNQGALKADYIGLMVEIGL